jgi:hypothetical protein
MASFIAPSQYDQSAYPVINIEGVKRYGFNRDHFTI